MNMARPVRAIFISHDASLYGAQRSLLSILENLDRSRVEPLFVAPMNGPLTELVAALGVPVRVLPLHHWVLVSNSRWNGPWMKRARYVLQGLWSRVRVLRRVIEQRGIDIVYTNTVTVLEGALAAKAAGIPHIWHLREQVALNSQLRSIVPPSMVPWIVKKLSERQIFNSNYLRDAYSARPLDQKVAVIFNGIDPEAFSADRKEARLSVGRELGLRESTRVISIIGAVIERKRPDLLVEAVSRLSPAPGNVACLVVGAGPTDYVESLKCRVTELGLEGRFHFLGRRDDVPCLLAASDALVIAADEEPFGRTAIEAMAAGTPVVATRCGGPEEIIDDGVSGLLVPCGDVDALARAMRRVLEDEGLWRTLVAGARRCVEARFTVGTYTEAVQREIESVAQAHDSSDGGWGGRRSKARGVS